MPNYQNGKIYRIICNISGKQYIGSTTISLASRLSTHKKVYNTINSCTSREVLKNNDYNIVLLEDYPCERKEQLLQKERYYIETMDCVNKKIPNRSKEEWYQDNKEDYIVRQKIWNNNNKDKLREYQKRFRDKGVVIDLNEMPAIELNIEEIYDSNCELIKYQEI
jgi:hypothetical protein